MDTDCSARGRIVGSLRPKRQPSEVEGAVRMPTKGVPDDEFRDLWFATLRQEWSALVVVPAHGGASAVPIARSLAEIGGVDLICAEGVTPGSSTSITQGMLASAARGRVIVALDPLVSNPAGLPVALAADAALLCVTLGQTEIASARRTVEMIGLDRFIGCIALVDA